MSDDEARPTPSGGETTPAPGDATAPPAPPEVMDGIRSLHERLDEKFDLTGIVGESPLLKEVIERVKKVAQSKATILIEGESGTGKELIAQAIHQSSPRSRGPFVAVHCAALSESLLESELFGHEKGSFTGATERRIGRFESADGGTLFLDEIGEISGSIQVKLLRFLETKAIDRVGGSKTIELDVRLVTATNRNLEQLVREGKDVTVLAYGTMVHVAEAAVRVAGVDAEIIDVRTMAPLDVDVLCTSVCKTGRCVVVHEATRFGGYGAELVATVQEHCFWNLEAPVQRVTGWDTPYPHAFEWHYFPGPARVIEAMRRAMGS